MKKVVIHLIAALAVLCLVSCTPGNENPKKETTPKYEYESIRDFCISEEGAKAMAETAGLANAQSIQVDYLVMWFGYRIRDTEYSANYMKEGAYRASYPEDEFEKLIYDYFGLTPEHLRKGEAYNAKEKAYVLPTALYDLASTEYTITKTEYNGDEMKIYFDLKIADNDPVSRILTVDTSNGGMRFLSCE